MQAISGGQADTVGIPAIDPAGRSMRAVHRAVSELRRGTPVILRSGAQAVVVVAVETVGARGLTELAAVARGAPILVLSPIRAAALSLVVSPPPEEHGTVGFRLPGRALDPALLRAFADPTAADLLRDPPEPAPAPRGSAAAIGLAKLARLLPAVLIAPAREVGDHGLLEVSAEQVSSQAPYAASSLRKVAEAALPLEDAEDARLVAFRAADGGVEHLALLVGHPERMPPGAGAPLARLHSECFTGDLLGSLRCDCGPQLRGAIRRMAADGAGVLLYLAQEGRGIGLPNKLRAYALQSQGLDTLDANRALGWGADERDFQLAAVMLRQLGIERVRLLTNNPAKVTALVASGIDVVGREAHAFAPNGTNDDYLATKARRFGHLLA